MYMGVSLFWQEVTQAMYTTCRSTDYDGGLYCQ